MNDLGIDCAWQQAQERMNRELKAERVIVGARTPLTLLDEVQSLMDAQQNAEILALQGKGEYRVVDALQGWTIAPDDWCALPEVEKVTRYKCYLKADIRKRTCAKSVNVSCCVTVVRLNNFLLITLPIT